MDARGASIVLIGIEGYWSAGKTTIASELADRLGGVYLPEPDHLKESQPIANLNAWYEAAFSLRQAQTFGDTIYVADRTPLSLVAYMSAVEIAISEALQQRIMALQSSYDAVFMLEQTRPELLSHSKYDSSPIVRDSTFMVRYMHELTRQIGMLPGRSFTVSSATSRTAVKTISQLIATL